MNLLGWAPKINKQYYDYMMIKDDTKIQQDHHSWEHSDSSTEAESDSWIWIDLKELAATAAQDTIPPEYEEFQHLFNQPEQSGLPMHSIHDHMIPLKEGKEPTCKRTYPMSEKESQALHDYVIDQL